ncbi:MAG: TrmH family RNA methyltransferase [Spirochaetia bacterium]
MISLRKLRVLPPDTRRRKMVRLLDGFVQYGSLPDLRYLEGLLHLIRETSPEGSAIAPPPILAETDNETTLRFIDKLRYELRSQLGIPVGDWDLLPPAGYGIVRRGKPGTTDPPRGTTGTVSVYMESIRSPFNAGSIVRSAVAFGVTRIGISPDCPPADHPRLVRTARGTERSVEIQRFPLTELPAEWRPLLALEVGGRVVDSFPFPDTGTLLVGSEELGLSREALEMAEERISVRMTGTKGSMNVGVACGIALHAWYVRAQVSRFDK